MHDWRSLSHVRWECKYHVVIVPKYRKRVFYDRIKKQIGEILREVCRQKGSNYWKGIACPTTSTYASAFRRSTAWRTRLVF